MVSGIIVSVMPAKLKTQLGDIPSFISHTHHYSEDFFLISIYADVTHLKDSQNQGNEIVLCQHEAAQPGYCSLHEVRRTYRDHTKQNTNTHRTHPGNDSVCV